MRDDDWDHLIANYWATTILCGLFLGVFLYMLQHQHHGLMVIGVGVLTLICAFFSLRLSRELRKMKKERRNINTR